MNTRCKYTEQTKVWLEDVIIGLNFCPFAKKEFVNNTIHYQVLTNIDLELSLEQLIAECKRLDDDSSIETTLIILADGFNFFDDYLDLVELGQQLLIAQGYEGVYQIASFHPDYVFADVDQNDESNFTNRSPYPTLHLIRENSLTRAVAAHPDPEGIPDRNIELCYQKGSEYFKNILLNIKK